MTYDGQIRLTILPNGDMLLQANNECRAWIAAEMRAGHRSSVIYDLFEYERCNGSYTPFEPGDGSPYSGPFVGLTDAPCIAEALTVEDDGTQVIDGKVWWFPDYMVTDEIAALRDRGRVIFTLGE